MEIKVNNELTQKVEDIQLNNNISLVNIIDLIRPIGSLYWSENNTNPSTIYPGTTWVQITDTFIVAAGSTYQAGSSYGAASHTHTSAAHTHSTGNHTLTVNEIPSHIHQVNIGNANNVNSLYWGPANVGGSASIWTATYSGDRSVATSNYFGAAYTGGSQPHNHGDTGSTTPGNTGSSSNIPPSVAMYCWKRTA